jgi:hypothetical protein
VFVIHDGGMDTIEGVLGLALLAGAPYLWFHRKHPDWWKSAWRLKKIIVGVLLAGAAFVLYARYSR